MTDGTSGVMSQLGTSGVLSTGTVASAVTEAGNVMTWADTAIEKVSTQRATFGAVSNRLEHAIDNLTNVSTQTAAARSRILDTDYAASTSELARTRSFNKLVPLCSRKLISCQPPYSRCSVNKRSLAQLCLTT